MARTRRFCSSRGQASWTRRRPRALLGGPGGEPDLHRLLARLGPRCPRDPPAGAPGPEGEGGAPSPWPGTLRLTLRLEGQGTGPRPEEPDLLGALAEDHPGPIWIEEADGSLVWANRACLALHDLVRPEGRGSCWPAQPLWPPPEDLDDGEMRQRRLTLALPGLEAPSVFDVTTRRRGGRLLHVAQDVTEVRRAEETRRQFVATLGKTFAHLPTGLAVFDRARRLILFNPALVDLTGLPPAFLSTRPPIGAVLDRLRDAGLLPEPRRYGSWRSALAALEAQASRDAYCETWNLPGERVWRVTGRPHPDGALAFLFEDISDEVAFARRARGELDTAHLALDALDEALAVFGADGTLLLVNAAYRTLWGPGGPGPRDLPAEAARWADGSEVPALDQALRGRPVRQEVVLAPAGQGPLRAILLPLPGGGTLVRFAQALPARPVDPPAAATGRRRSRGSARPRAAAAPPPCRCPDPGRCTCLR
ncbi:PAS-domain containing protein [Rubellimicrobium sp. CFH 75288]|uniref:PAS-domain containing protein n=1 Tax=Rubellimicrobium sp. CFH 75288 TaxID=2697034 RepID=UPI0014132939|nr:PAS-domain containing protein [Rubellimicrobium sp. CFH 75288]NAZ37792.1 PAS domain-containing protein [Rubellimicrobium sp. CFH 75288]